MSHTNNKRYSIFTKGSSWRKHSQIGLNLNLKAKISQAEVEELKPLKIEKLEGKIKHKDKASSPYQERVAE